MAPFHAKISWEMPRKREYKLSFRSVHTQRVIKNSKKKRRKIKKSNNAIGAAFQVKIGLKRPRNRENKNCRSVSFPPNV